MSLFFTLIVACCLLLPPWSFYMSVTVSHGCWPSLTVFQVPYSCYMSLIVAGCLSLSLPVVWSCIMSFTVSYGCWLSLTVSSIPWSHYVSLTVSHCVSLPLTVSLVLFSCYMCLIFAGCLSLSHPVPWYYCMSHALFSSSIKLLHVLHYLLLFLAVSHCLYQCHGVSRCLSLSLIVAGSLSLSLRSYIVAVCL